MVYQLAAAILKLPHKYSFDFIVVTNLNYNLTTVVKISQRHSENAAGVDSISKALQRIRQMDNLCTF